MKIQSFQTIVSAEKSSYKENSSEFITKIFPIKTLDGFQAKLQAIKKEYHNATHHCYAFHLVNGGEKYSDDGEPAGTAGIRILNAIHHYELKDVAIIVVRYFGGTKLGVGPLGIAYSQAAMLAISKCKIICKRPFLPLSVTIPFEQTSKIYHLFSLHHVKLKETLFSENATYHILLLFEEKDSFLQKLNDLFNGKIEVTISDRIEYFE